MDLTVRQVSPTDEAVISLIDKLNAYQIGLYGLAACNLEPPESLERNMAYMLGAFSSEVLAAIGAIKLCGDYGEIKRMYVDEPYRGLSIAETLLKNLELHALRSGIYRICLETGNKHFAAMRFYKKMGYDIIEQFGNYQPNAVSIYFEKRLTREPLS